MPHLTLQNVVVSEDSAFGNEPIIRANVVEANLRLSSLWRSMEFSRVRFVEPSVNLVRNAEGRWNLEGVLVHAAQVNTAPTAQQHRSDAPRFPYIEATGGRVNIKVGDEKKPFSLVDTDFALWLPSPEQWSVRLIGTPARTNTNLTDSGTLRVEGTLQRAAHMPQVPLSLQASWHNAPLGEATRLLTGDDQGWRGAVQVDASIRGSLGAGRLETDITVDDLRRADFVPEHTLSLHLHCAALADLATATLQNAACSLPTGAIQPGATQPLRLQSESVDLVRPSKAAVTIEAEAMPLDWVASWVRLFSARFPTAPVLPGSIEANLIREAVPAAGAGRPIEDSPGDNRSIGWAGSLTLRLPFPPGVPSPPTAASSGMATEAPAGGSPVGGSPADGPPSAGVASTLRGQPVTAEVSSSSSGDAWRITLPPTLVRLSANSALNFSGTATSAGYSLRAAGQASPAVILSFARRLPPLADGLPSALGLVQGLAQGLAPAPGEGPVRLDLTCSRAWSAAVSGDQTCTRAQEIPRRTIARPRR